jgi:hypothetical protein
LLETGIVFSSFPVIVSEAWQSYSFLSLRAQRGNLIKKNKIPYAQNVPEEAAVFQGKNGKSKTKCQLLEKKREMKEKFSLRELTE